MQKGYIKAIISATLVLIIVIVGYFILKHYITTNSVTINLNNVSTASITKDGNEKIIKRLSGPDSIKLEKYNNYTINYDAEVDYADGDVKFWVGQEPVSVDIKPYYSKDKLSILLEVEKDSILLALRNKLSPLINDYETTNYELLRYGDWAIVKLKYKGQSISDTDDLRIVLNKKDGVWEPLTTPVIIVSLVTFPNVPQDIAKAANSL